MCVPLRAKTVAAAMLLLLAAPGAAAASPLTGRIFTVAGYVHWQGPRSEAHLATGIASPAGDLAALTDGGFLIADGAVERVLPDGRRVTVRGTAGADWVSVIPDGGFIFSSTEKDWVKQVWPNGRVRIVAGTGRSGFSGDGGRAVRARLDNPQGIAAIPGGGFLVSDEYNSRVRRVWPSGRITTVAGTGKEGFAGDGGRAIRAKLDDPVGVAYTPGGGFLIADLGNWRVRRVWPNGRITTVAGNGRAPWDGPLTIRTRADMAKGTVTNWVPARVAKGAFASRVPAQVASGTPATWVKVDASAIAVLPGGGFVYAGESGVERVSRQGRVSDVTGGRLWGDGGPASQAWVLNGTGAVAVTPDGGILIGEANAVRLVVGSRAPQLLGVAVRPRFSRVSARSYRARIVLTRSATVTVGIHRTAGGRAVAFVRAWHPAGASFVTVPVRPGWHGIYGLDVLAADDGQAVRAEQYVWLGGTITARGAHDFDYATLAAEAGGDPNAEFDVGSCKRFTRTRADCVVEAGYEDFIDAIFLTADGQLISRPYDYAPSRPFVRSPKWLGDPVWRDLGIVWTAR